MVITTSDVVSALTAAGVAVAAWQLWLAHRQATTTFEDSLASRYRDLMQELPVEALLGGVLSAGEHTKALPVFYNYFDFCNEQAFLREKRRVRASTWDEWREGIEENLRRPAFARAWSEIAARVPESFDKLRELVRPQPVHAAIP